MIFLWETAYRYDDFLIAVQSVEKQIASLRLITYLLYGREKNCEKNKWTVVFPYLSFFAVFNEKKKREKEQKKNWPHFEAGLVLKLFLNFWQIWAWCSYKLGSYKKKKVYAHFSRENGNCGDEIAEVECISWFVTSVQYLSELWYI